MRQNRSIIVTGGAQGIGLAIAELLLTAGDAVAILDSDEEALGRLGNLRDKYEGNVLIVRCDVADESSVKSSVAKVLQTFERIDGLVNNAGIANPVSGPVAELKLVDWQRWIDVDLTGPLLMAKHCVPQLEKTKGAIVNIVSTRAIQSEPDCEAYAAAKGGLLSLTHALAVSLAGKLRVNAISPGWIVTDDFKPGEEKTELSEEDHKQHPAGRVGNPLDVANLVKYLLSDEAGFITAENFIVDGGMTRKMIYM